MLTEEQLDGIRAEVLIGIFGETTDPFEKTDGWQYAVAHWRPEWLTELEDTWCFTVLDFGLQAAKPPPGYTVAHQYAAGEQSCPWCGDGTGEEHRRPECELCEGDGLIYWGEECQVVVFQSIVPDIAAQLRALQDTIEDDFRAHEEAEEPSMQVTIATDNGSQWVYQTGDNSFSGPCYPYQHWAVIDLYREHDPDEVLDLASDAVRELVELVERGLS